MQQDVRPSTYVIVFDQRHHSSGLRVRGKKRNHVMIGANEARQRCTITVEHTQTYQLIVPTMKVISVPEAPLVAFNVANLASFVLKIWLPHQ